MMQEQYTGNNEIKNINNNSNNINNKSIRNKGDLCAKKKAKMLTTQPGTG